MMKHKLCLITIFLTVLYNQSRSQDNNGEYIVITFEETYKRSQHGSRLYYWIIQNDSLESYESTLSKFFVDGFSVNNREDCCKGKQVDPFLVFDNSHYDFDEDYLHGLAELKMIIHGKRRKVQTIRKKWTNGQTVKIRVYVTPVIGSFCSSQYHVLGQARSGYYGMIYLPSTGNFKSNDFFWDNPKIQYLLSRDFTKIDYDIIR